MNTGEEWIYSIPERTFSNADTYECEYNIDSVWVKSYDVSWVYFDDALRQWHIRSYDSTKEILFDCNPCEESNNHQTYEIKVRMRFTCHHLKIGE